MTDDIVERLRIYEWAHPVIKEAADEIERLRVIVHAREIDYGENADEIERLQAALREIAKYDTDADGNWGFFRDEADAALAGEKPND